MCLTLFSDHLVREEINKEIKDLMKFNESDSTAYPNLWGTMKAVLRAKLIALSASIKELEKSYTSSSIAHLKVLEQKEENTPRSRW